ncbi:hypothetical protein DOM22_06995 [Bdellovibrio sp. ZAP7]|uniref:hypothetical protein n=1 Tax=Bdellovibrio sp. ZAP7 TaxID=2231053 RepID=UPI001157DFD6|nr:hypothetical protein [Bdellovibrio sp. ZAP7]QDK44926.1 hypothetical protein DOM22_06995 [Bdellovibrio sp. ZAP7]
MSKKHHHKSSHKNSSSSTPANSVGQEMHPSEVEYDSAVENTIDKADEIAVSSSDDINTEAQNEGVPHPTHEPHHDSGTFNAGSADDKLAPEEMSYEGGPTEEHHEKSHVEFYGSEIIRMKAPKVMEIADTVVDEWKKDGDFESLPVGHPLAAMAAGRALRKAKEVEKKLEEKGVFAMAKMGLDYVKSEIEKRKKQ